MITAIKIIAGVYIIGLAFALGVAVNETQQPEIRWSRDQKTDFFLACFLWPLAAIPFVTAILWDQAIKRKGLR